MEIQQMDNLDQLNVIKDFTDVIDSLGISYLIGGSIASSLHGIVRFTEDADITVEPFDAKANDFIDSLKGRYYISSDAMNQALLNRTSFNAIHIETAFKIDVFIQKNNPFDNQMMEHSVKRKLSDSVEKPFSIATPEDIVLLKLNWYKQTKSIKPKPKQWANNIKTFIDCMAHD